MELKSKIREIPDFPTTGVNFKDITTLLKDPVSFAYLVDSITEFYSNLGVTKVVSLESRGFIVGGAVAYRLGAGFVPVRKKGRLPGPTVSVSYDLEYGSDIIELHTDALVPDDVVLIHDDLLATGGTALAALELVQKLNVSSIYFSFLCDLSFIQSPLKDRLNGFLSHVMVTY